MLHSYTCMSINLVHLCCEGEMRERLDDNNDDEDVGEEKEREQCTLWKLKKKVVKVKKTRPFARERH